MVNWFIKAALDHPCNSGWVNEPYSATAVSAFNFDTNDRKNLPHRLPSACRCLVPFDGCRYSKTDILPRTLLEHRLPLSPPERTHVADSTPAPALRWTLSLLSAWQAISSSLLISQANLYRPLRSYTFHRLVQRMST